MTLPLDREITAKPQCRKTLSGIFQRGNLGMTVKWFGISFAIIYLGIECTESFVSLYKNDSKYLSVSGRRYS